MVSVQRTFVCQPYILNSSVTVVNLSQRVERPEFCGPLSPNNSLTPFKLNIPSTLYNTSVPKGWHAIQKPQTHFQWRRGLVPSTNQISIESQKRFTNTSPSICYTAQRFILKASQKSNFCHFHGKHHNMQQFKRVHKIHILHKHSQIIFYSFQKLWNKKSGSSKTAHLTFSVLSRFLLAHIEASIPTIIWISLRKVL